MTTRERVPVGAFSQLVLVRHGETEWSRSGQHTGRTDLPLTDHGRDQAEKLRARLSGLMITAVISSPLVRAVETCKLAGLSSIALSDELASEWDYGDYEGLTSEEIWRSRPSWRLFRDGCPNGEVLEQVSARARALLARAVFHPGADQALCIVSHGHFLRVLAACFLGLSPIDGEHLVLSAASVSVLGFEHEVRCLWRWNS